MKPPETSDEPPEAGPVGHERVEPAERKPIELDMPSVALIDERGVVSDIRGRASASFITARPHLVTYARSLMRVGGAQLRFVWLETDTRWLRVTVRLTGEDDACGRGAVVEVHAINPVYGFTTRELDVLTLLAAGFSNEAIASRLDISQRTVTKHVEHIFKKTDIRTRAGVAGVAVDQGILRLPTPGGPRDYPLRTGHIERVAVTLDNRVGVKPQPPVRRPAYCRQAG